MIAIINVLRKSPHFEANGSYRAIVSRDKKQAVCLVEDLMSGGSYATILNENEFNVIEELQIREKIENLNSTSKSSTEETSLSLSLRDLLGQDIKSIEFK